MTTIVGIDPGEKSGGVAVIHDDHALPHVIPMPSIEDFADIMEELALKRSHVFIEKAQSFPKQGIASAFNYGRHFGELLGVIMAFKMPHTLVPPRTWTKVMHAGTKDADTKSRSIEAVRRLFPLVLLVPEESRAKKPHLGIVEALLIAEYGRRTLK